MIIWNLVEVNECFTGEPNEALESNPRDAIDAMSLLLSHIYFWLCMYLLRKTTETSNLVPQIAYLKTFINKKYVHILSNKSTLYAVVFYTQTYCKMQLKHAAATK